MQEGREKASADIPPAEKRFQKGDEVKQLSSTSVVDDVKAAAAAKRADDMGILIKKIWGGTSSERRSSTGY